MKFGKEDACANFVFAYFRCLQLFMKRSFFEQFISHIGKTENLPICQIKDMIYIIYSMTISTIYKF